MLVIRDVEEADLESVIEIWNALLDTTTYEWSENRHTIEEAKEWLERHRSDGAPTLVAIDDDVVVGIASYADFRDSVRKPGYRFVVEHSIHVAESHWRRGVGRALVTAVAERAASAGKWVIVAAIDGTNTRSVAFHSDMGFVEVGRMPGIGEKFGRHLDLVLMQRAIVEPE